MQVSIHDPKEAGPAIRRGREQQGMSQNELALKAKVSRRTLAGLELGEATDPHLSTVQALGRVLGITFILEPGHREEAQRNA